MAPDKESICKVNPRLAYEWVPGVAGGDRYGIARIEPRLWLFGRGFFWRWTGIVYADDDFAIIARQLDMLIGGL